MPHSVHNTPPGSRSNSQTRSSHTDLPRINTSTNTGGLRRSGAVYESPRVGRSAAAAPAYGNAGPSNAVPAFPVNVYAGAQQAARAHQQGYSIGQPGVMPSMLPPQGYSAVEANYISAFPANQQNVARDYVIQQRNWVASHPVAQRATARATADAALRNA